MCRTVYLTHRLTSVNFLNYRLTLWPIVWLKAYWTDLTAEAYRLHTKSSPHIFFKVNKQKQSNVPAHSNNRKNCLSQCNNNNKYIFLSGDPVPVKSKGNNNNNNNVQILRFNAIRGVLVVVQVSKFSFICLVLPVWASKRTDWGGSSERRAPEQHSCLLKTSGPGKLTPGNRSVEKPRRGQI